MNHSSLNFCTHAIESLGGMVEGNKSTLLTTHPSDRHDLALVTNFFELICDLLNDAVKFTLPDNGRLISKSDEEAIITSRELELLKIPYDIVALEYTAAGLNSRLAEGNEASTKRISLAFNFGKISDQYRSAFCSLMPTITADYEDKIGVISVYYSQDFGWCPSSGAVFIDKDSPFRTDKDSNGNEYTVTACLPALLNYKNFKVTSRQQMISELGGDTADECIVLAEFCAIMNCSNVSTSVIEPSAKLNKKRIASGKRPMYEYHVLMLDPSSQSGGGKTSGGSHASPRMHLRRGHIRRLSESRSTWVNAAVIGKKTDGIVDKSYSLRPKK